MTLAAALAAASALAMAESNQSMYMFGASVSAQSTTTQNEASPPQAAYPSQPQAGASVDEDNGYASDEAAGSDDSDDSAMESNDSDNSARESGDPDHSAMESADADTDSDMATEPNTARAYGPSAPSISTAEEAPPDEAASVAAPAPVYESVPAYIAPPNSPRYTPETGDAEYGSKLNPAGPQSDRFNDATGQ